MRIGYFPGCSMEGSAREYGESLHAIAPYLGVELIEVCDWNCCGATAAHCLNHKLALALPARTLALAEQQGLEELVVPCSACYARMIATNHEIRRDDKLRAEIADIIELPLAGKVRILNVLELLQRCAAEGLKEKVQKPFGRRVACYYGCYLVRPAELVSCKQTEDPQEMDDLMRLVGATPVDWAFKVDCCGAGHSVTRTDLVGELSARIVEDAVDRGADAIAVACPMCHTNLDLRRQAIQDARGREFTIPVMYLTQIIGLALGLDDKTLGLHRHHVPVRFPQAATQPVGATAAKTSAPAGKEG